MKDIDIRRVLRAEMNSSHAGEADTLIIEELGMCQGVARVDLAVVNGSVHGYEIKSERDTLTRLPSQSRIYSQALEFVTIISAPNHLAGIVALVPTWWGIWSADDKGSAISLTPVREARRNPSITPLALAQFLWRDEVFEILFEHLRSSAWCDDQASLRMDVPSHNRQRSNQDEEEHLVSSGESSTNPIHVEGA